MEEINRPLLKPVIPSQVKERENSIFSGRGHFQLPDEIPWLLRRKKKLRFAGGV